MMRGQRAVRLWGLVVLASALVTGAARVDPASAPPAPARYRVEIAYRIYAAGQQRVSQFRAMLRYLRSVGFDPDPVTPAEVADPTATRLGGTVAPDRACDLLEDLHVQSLLLVPADYRLPDDPEALVKVQLRVVAGLSPDRQRLLADQVREKLREIGFQESVGYDDRGNTRIVGRLPRVWLDSLLGDLRWVPGGWLTPAAPAERLPSPIRNISPVLLTEATPEPDGSPPAREPVTGPPSVEGNTQKIDPALRAGARREGGPTRIEVILFQPPAPGSDDWQQTLTQAVPGLLVEGRAGAIVTVLAPPRAAFALAELPVVSGLRLPRPAPEPLATATALPPADDAAVLAATGLAEWHRKGWQGQRVRLAVVGNDFEGYARFVGRGLPARTRYVDLTAARNPEMQPDPYPGPAGRVGYATQCALAAALAAPQAELTLVRVDSAAPYQIEEFGRWLKGEAFVPPALAQRNMELNALLDHVRLIGQQVTELRRDYLENYGREADLSRRRETEVKGAAEVEKEMQRLREALDKRQAELEAAERLYRERQGRFLGLNRDYRGLGGLTVIGCTLAWEQGYAADGRSPLTRFLNDRPPRKVLWFQSAGDTRGQVWSGRSTDTDGNGVMRFAPPGALLPAGRWTAGLNFLGWRSVAGQTSADLPAGRAVRLTVQWQEPHDPAFFLGPGDPYRRPLASLILLVLRQRDPTGKQLPADDMEVVARSTGLPQRLANSSNEATYELALDFTPDVSGRYAVRIEGSAPPGIRPPNAPSIPALERSWELWPRLLVSTANPTSPVEGGPVLLDYAHAGGAVATPADASTVVAVAAAPPGHTPLWWSAMDRALLRKPDLVGPGMVGGPATGRLRAFGGGVAASFAAGWAATLLSAETPPSAVAQIIAGSRGRWLRAPSPPEATPKR